MKIKKKFSTIFIILTLMMLSNCIQSSVSLFGPTMTAVKTGSVHQSGLSYVSSKLVKVQFKKISSKDSANILIKNSELEKSSIKMEKTENLNLKRKPETIRAEYYDFLSSVKEVLK